MKTTFKLPYIFIFLNVFALLFTNVHAKTCNPAVRDSLKMEIGYEGINTVVGTVASFDPCHRSVSLRTPFFAEKPALMILVHGGAGLVAGTQNAADAFRSIGMATLVFDAFEMNGFYQGPRFFATSVTLEAKQRMIYQAALGAYEWAIQQEKIDNSRIFFHGLSNGAIVVANLAAVVNPRHVVALLAEGAPSQGIGLPNEIKAPLKMIYGRLDNYGGRTVEHFIWARQQPCRQNVVVPTLPPGNSATCNRQTGGLSQAPIDWFEDQKAKGANVELMWLDETAHGVFDGPIVKNMISYTNGIDRFAWVGGSSKSRKRLLELVQALVKDPRLER